jgi:hypothetical protein
LKCVTIIFVAGGICVTMWCYRSGILKKLNSVEMKQQNLLNQILIQGLGHSNTIPCFPFPARILSDFIHYSVLV